MGAGYKGIGRLFDLASGHLRAVVPGEATHQVAFTPDGRILIARCCPSWLPPHFIQISDLATGRVLRRFERMGAFALSPDGQEIATTDFSAKVTLWDLYQRQPKRQFQIPRGAAVRLAYQSDGSALAIGTDYGAIWVCQLATGKWNEITIGHQGNVNHIAYSCDGTAIAWQIEFRFLCMCDTATGNLRIDQDLGAVYDLAFSPDGKTLATTGNAGRLILWNVATGLRLLEWEVPNRSTFAVVFSPDGQTLAASGRSDAAGVAYLWSGPRNIEAE